MTQHFYVICADYVGSEATERAAIDTAARLDAGDSPCAGSHAVITATGPSAAREAYCRWAKHALHTVHAP